MNEEQTKLVVTHIVSGDLWAGAEAQVFNLFRALRASRHVELTAVLFNHGILFDRLTELGISVSLANEKELGPAGIVRKIADHCKRHRSQIVHTHGFKENLLGIMGKELARVPYSIRTVHGNPETRFSLRSSHKWLVRRLDLMIGRWRQQAVIAVSSQLEEALEPLFPGKVHKIFNFVDVNEIRELWSCSNGPIHDPIRIGIVGRLVQVKRVDLFIETIALLNGQGVNSTGVIVGSGPMESQLKEVSRDLGIENKIEFAGFTDPALKEIRKLDLLLMPSDHEGLPMTLLEAMALGIPVVAHDVGGIPEVLEYGALGILVTDHSPQGYADAVKQCLDSSPTESDQRVARGLGRLLERFDINSNGNDYLKIYTSLSGNAT